MLIIRVLTILVLFSVACDVISQEEKVEFTISVAKTYQTDQLLQKYKKRDDSYHFIKFTDNKNGWVAGFHSLIKTTDSGLKWSEVKLPNSDITINDIQIISDKEFIILSVDYSKVNEGRNTIFMTSDGGTNWKTIPIDIKDNTTSKHIVFSTMDKGLCLGDNLYFTNDGGKSWMKKAEEPRAISFVDKNIGLCAVENGKEILKTTDGGENWGNVFSPKTHKLQCPMDKDGKDNVPKKIFVLKFFNEKEGWIVARHTFKVEHSDVYRTTDGGKTWLPTEPIYDWTAPKNKDKAISSKVFFLDNNTAYLVELDKGSIVSTKDGGKTWKEEEQLPPVENCCFIDSKVGFYISRKAIFKTTNGGEKWEKTDYEIEDSMADERTKLEKKIEEKMAEIKANEEKNPPAGNCSISGRLVNKASRKGLDGVNVLLSNSKHVEVNELAFTVQYKWSVKTDKDGNFKFTNLMSTEEFAKISGFAKNKYREPGVYSIGSLELAKLAILNKMTGDKIMGEPIDLKGDITRTYEFEEKQEKK